MKNIDYIIVGGGYAGLFFAHQLIKNKKSFVLFTDENKGASQVSAGIVNPVVLKRFTTFWLANEQIDFLEKTLDEIQVYTGRNYGIKQPVQRIFHDEGEQKLWRKKAENETLQPFLNTHFDYAEGVNNPFKTGIVNHSLRLAVSDFFEDFFGYLSKENILISERFEYDSLNKNTYKDFRFKHIVFCEGMEVKRNPFFNFIPVEPNKGHHLLVKLAQPLPSKFTIKKKHFLFPLKDGLYYYGGTYDRDGKGEVVDPEAVRQLKEGLQEIYQHHFDIVEVKVGFRPTVKDRRPILGRHATEENYYIFNGLGARGILNGSYFSAQLYNFIENGTALNDEVSLERFS